MARDRGRRPARSAGTLRETPAPPNYDDETPKFCLRHVCRDFDVHALDAQGQAAFAKTLQKLAQSRWKELITAPKHGQGSEFIPREQIKPPIPVKFEDREKFLVFRYNGRLPMAGARVNDIYHVLWIEPEFNQLYEH